MFKKIFTILLILVLSSGIGYCTTKYDKYGNRTGSYRTTSDGTTTSYDKYGSRTGSYKINSNGITNSYDKYGNRVGTYK